MTSPPLEAPRSVNGFDVASFLAHFEVLATSSGGTNQLRQLALQLAFQGRFTGNTRPLVPAVVSEDHEALSTAGGREAATTLVPGAAALAVGPAPMLIPEGWAWVPLMSVAKLESGHTPSRNHADYWDGGIPWIGIRDARDHNFGWIDSTIQTVSKKGLENSSARLLPAGTVCLSRTASVGYVTIMRRPMATSQDFVNWVCGGQLLPEFLMQLLRCEVPVLKRFSKGAVHQTIYFPEVKAFHISLPPLAEQKRIVARVDQLMALIDDLEAKQTKKRDLSTRFTKASLEALTTADSPEAFDTAWKRVVENFDTVVDRAEKVPELRRTLLTLAMRGALLGARGDDSAEELVDELARARSKLAVRTLEQYEPVTDEEVPYRVPAGWRWIRLGMLGTFVGGGTPAKSNAAFWKGSLPWVSPKDMKRPYIEDSEDHISTEALSASAVKLVPPQSLLMVVRGMILAHSFPVALTARNVTINQDMKALVLALPQLAEFVLRAAQAARSRVLAQVERSSHGTCRLETDIVANLPIALPPLRHQTRVLQQVEHLTRLCDNLEAQLRHAEDRASKLVEAVVQEMVT